MTEIQHRIKEFELTNDTTGEVKDFELVHEGKYYGLRMLGGKIILPSIFEEIIVTPFESDYSRARLCVKSNGIYRYAIIYCQGLSDYPWQILNPDGHEIAVLNLTGETTAKQKKTGTSARSYVEVQNGGGEFIKVCRKIRGNLCWGFINEQGEEIIPCKYDYVSSFGDGYARVILDDERYFINLLEERVLTCDERYEYGTFDDGVCEVWDEDDHIGLIDKYGVWVDPMHCRDRDELCYSEGLAADDYCDDYPTPYYNEKDDEVIPARDLYIYNGGPFNERLAVGSHTMYGNYGYFDQRGQVIIPFTFTNACNFEKGMAAASINGNWGFIDREANNLVPFRYDLSRDHRPIWFTHKGVCAVTIALERDDDIGVATESLSGVIDRTGREIVPIKYKQVAMTFNRIAALRFDGKIDWYDAVVPDLPGYAFRFPYDDYAVEKVARLKGGKLEWGLLGKDENEIIPCRYDELLFNDGIIRLKEDGLWGLFDLSGNRITESIYDSAFAEFVDDLSAVQREGKWGFVNKLGQEVVPCRYDSVTDFDDQISLVRLGGMYGFININGEETTPLKYRDAYPMLNGLASVCDDEDHWGAVNKAGIEVIPCMFSGIGKCSEGLVSVYAADDILFLDTEGRTVIDLKDMDVVRTSVFSEGLCAVFNRDREFGVINRDGELVIPFKYHFPYFNVDCKFESGLCTIQSPEHYRLVGCIDRQGNIVIEPIYRNIVFLNDDLLAAIKDEMVGVISRTGEVILPFEFSCVSIKGDRIEVEQDGKKGYYSLKGEVIEPCK